MRYALLLLATLAAPAAGQGSPWSVRGTVRDSGGRPVRGVQVTQAGASRGAATSDAEGVFKFDPERGDTARLVFRRLGFRPAEFTVAHVTDVATLDVRLVPIPLPLLPVKVMARPDPSRSRLAGFEQRVHRGSGVFITRERLDQLQSRRFTDALRNVPGVQISPNPFVRGVRFRGQRCPPLVVLDGAPATAGEFDLDMIDLGSVEGIEIYRSSATVPVEFNTTRNLEACGVIAIWSRPARDHRREGADEARERVQGALRAGSDTAYLEDEVDLPADLTSGLSVVGDTDAPTGSGPLRADLQFVVGADGRVDGSRPFLMECSAAGWCDRLRRAIQEAPFTPAQRNGVAVAQWVRLPVEFRRSP